MAKLSDQKVAAALADFRERPQKEQESSPIFQELIQFPGWGMAHFDPKKAGQPASTPVPPDPRLPAAERAAALKEQGAVTEPPTKKPPATPGAITTKDAQGQTNPWKDVKTPEGDGPTFIGLRTDVAPPFPGNWRKTPDGWFREA